MINHYYVNVEVRTGEYLNFGSVNTNIYKNTTNEFIKYIQEEAVFKVNSRLILNNLNYISFIYLSTEYNDETVVKNIPADKDIFKGNPQWLNIKYNDLYNKLVDNKQVIVGYMMVYDNVHNSPGYKSIDIIETRIRRNNLASVLITEYMNKTKTIIVPEIPLKGTENFWLKSPVFNCCTTPEEINEIHKEAYGYSDIQKIAHRWDNLMNTVKYKDIINQ